MSATAHQSSIKQSPEGYRFCLRHRLDHDPETIWAMLTEPKHLVQWLAPGRIELTPGGRAQIDFEDSGTPIDSKVRAVQPPHLLEYSWGTSDEVERPLRWEIDADGDGGAQLSLTLDLPVDEQDVAKACAGWDAHLQMLMAALEGVPVRFPVDHFLTSRQHYRDQLSKGATTQGA